MEFVYKKVSIEDAKKVLDGDDAQVRRPSWSKQRAQLKKEHLLPDALKWMAQLPKRVRPFKLGRLHPRIVNEIFRRWDHTVRCDRYFAELLIIDSPARKRQGFSSQVASEIADLAWYRAEL